MRYCVHFEPVGDYRHATERPIAWVARLYEGDDPDACFAAQKEYVAMTTLARTCLNIAEAKGLTTTVTASMFRALMQALPRIGIEILEFRRAGDPRVHIYETSDFCRG